MDNVEDIYKKYLLSTPLRENSSEIAVKGFSGHRNLLHLEQNYLAAFANLRKLPFFRSLGKRSRTCKYLLLPLCSLILKEKKGGSGNCL